MATVDIITELSGQALLILTAQRKLKTGTGNAILCSEAANDWEKNMDPQRKYQFSWNLLGDLDLGPASVWQYAGRSLKATAARFGCNLSRGKGLHSFLLCPVIKASRDRRCLIFCSI
jgi:hypothetical protein